MRSPDGRLGVFGGIDVIEAPFLHRDMAVLDASRHVLLVGSMEVFRWRLFVEEERSKGRRFVAEKVAEVRARWGLDDTSSERRSDHDEHRLQGLPI